MLRFIFGVAVVALGAWVGDRRKNPLDAPPSATFKRNLDATIVRLPVDGRPGETIEGHIILYGIEAARLAILMPCEGPCDAFVHQVFPVVWNGAQRRAFVASTALPDLIVPDFRVLTAELRARGWAQVRCPDPRTDLSGPARCFCIPGCCGAPGILAAVGFKE